MPGDYGYTSNIETPLSLFRTEISGLTRSGRCFTPEELEKQRKAKGKEVLDLDKEFEVNKPVTDHAMEDYESLDFEFPDEDVLAIEEEKSDWWIMYFDGAVNVCGNGAGAVIISPDKKQYPVSVKL